MTSTEQLSKPIRLSDGTEIYETVQVKQLYTMSGFAVHQKPYRRRNPQSEEELQSIKEEEINLSHCKRQFAGGKARPIDSQLTDISRNEYDTQIHPLFYDDDENPYEKYGRLRMELHRFTQDLQDYGKESTNESEKRTVSLLTQSLKELTRNLENFRNESKYQSFFEKAFSYQLESVKTTQLQKLGNKIGSFKQSLSAVPSKKRELNENKSEDQVLLQLCRQETPMSSLGTVDYQFINYEERIAKLEKLVGHIADMSNPFPDVVCAVNYLRGKYDLFEEQSADIKVSCQKMASDIKAISYSFANLTMTIQKTITSKQAEKTFRNRRMTPFERNEMIERYKQFEKIDYLWTIMRKWDHVVFDLIRIVARFVSLQNFHHRSVLLCNRADLLFKQQSHILSSLRQDNLTLKLTLKSIAQNKMQTDKNFAYVKHRINYLEEKLK